MASYAQAPASVILDNDDTCDVAHGRQQRSLFNAHYDERRFLPIHVYDTQRSRPVAFVLRPGKTPGGVELRARLRRLVRHIRKRWTKARVEATTLGLDIRFVVANLAHGSPEWIYDSLYCARGQMENLIKLRNARLASDRASCRSAIANQARLVLHTTAYWLMLDVSDAIPKLRDLAKAEFATLRLQLIEIAARVIETAGRERLAFAACCPEADLFRGLPPALASLSP